jgi:hypothetical protein
MAEDRHLLPDRDARSRGRGVAESDRLAEAAKRADVGVYHLAATSAPSGRAVVQKPGRYVRVWGAKRQELNLSEVQVFPSLSH